MIDILKIQSLIIVFIVIFLFNLITTIRTFNHKYSTKKISTISNEILIKYVFQPKYSVISINLIFRWRYFHLFNIPKFITLNINHQ